MSYLAPRWAGHCPGSDGDRAKQREAHGAQGREGTACLAESPWGRQRNPAHKQGEKMTEQCKYQDAGFVRPLRGRLTH